MDLSRNHLYWICQLVGWSSLTLINIIFQVAAGSLNANTLLYLVSIMVFGIVSTNYYRELIKRWRWVDLSIGPLLPRVILSSILITLVTHILTVLTFYVLRYDAIMETPVSSETYSPGFNLYLSLVNVTFVCFFWSVIYFSYHYIENRNKTLKWEATVNEFELNRLKSQLNPHFIFNALNSVRALIDENPLKAKLAVTQLSNLLRNTLSMDKKKLISFEEEMRTVQDYLALESIRFEERLKVSYHLHPHTHRYEVPPMMVQTLVENSIKHGISKLTRGGEISIESDVQDGQLIIRISNSGQIEEGNAKSESGYGLSNTRERLRLLYNDLASFRIGNLNDHNVLTEIRIPINS